MPSIRTKSISTKVTDEEYAQMEALAGAQTISEWAREVLLKASRANPNEQVVLAELLAFRTILLNALYRLSQKQELTGDEMQQLIDTADEERFRRAEERLAAAAYGGAS